MVAFPLSIAWNCMAYGIVAVDPEVLFYFFAAALALQSSVPAPAAYMQLQKRVEPWHAES